MILFDMLLIYFNVLLFKTCYKFLILFFKKKIIYLNLNNLLLKIHNKIKRDIKNLKHFNLKIDYI